MITKITSALPIRSALGVLILWATGTCCFATCECACIKSGNIVKKGPANSHLICKLYCQSQGLGSPICGKVNPATDCSDIRIFLKSNWPVSAWYTPCEAPLGGEDTWLGDQIGGIVQHLEIYKGTRLQMGRLGSEYSSFNKIITVPSFAIVCDGYGDCTAGWF